MRLIGHKGNRKQWQALLGRGLVVAMTLTGLMVMSELGQFLARALIDDSVQQVEWRQESEEQALCFGSLGDSSVRKHWKMAQQSVEVKP